MARKVRDKKYRLTVYLMKKDCANHGDVLKDASSLKRYDLRNRSTDDMALYVKESRSYKPPWTAYFDGHLKRDISDLYNSSSSAALIVKHSQRYFAFTFGYGNNLLDPKNIEEAFGFKVALNSIDHEKIRSVDIRNHDTILRQSRIQTSQAASVDTFGMNVDRDILNAVKGVSNDAALGKSITGSDALHISVPVKIDDLPSLCASLWTKLKDDSYKEHFDWVDNIREVKNPALIDELNNSLVDAINKRELEDNNIYLAVPELIDWEHIEGFKYRPSDDVQEDIAIQDVLPSEEDEAKEISLDWLRQRDVLCIAKENDQIYDHWSLYKCINCEIKRKKASFLLTGGKWFKIDSDFVETVNKEIARIPEYKQFQFPPYEEKREDEYNSKVYNQNKQKCVLMDKKNIRYGGGRSQIEFCDLFINKSDLVHVKRFRGSSALSHLFQQGFTSASLLVMDSTFVVEVNKLLPQQWRFNGSPKAMNHEVVYAIISRAKGGVKDIFPFFSKVSLRQIYRQLLAYGFKVSVAKIGA